MIKFSDIHDKTILQLLAKTSDVRALFSLFYRALLSTSTGSREGNCRILDQIPFLGMRTTRQNLRLLFARLRFRLSATNTMPATRLLN